MSTHTASKRNEHISAIQNFINTKKTLSSHLPERVFVLLSSIYQND